MPTVAFPDWSANIVYVKNSVVYYADVLYVSLSIQANHVPTNTDYWAVLGTLGGGATNTFAAADFNVVDDEVSIDYTNGQASSALTKGFLTAANWSTFNSKVAGPASAVDKAVALYDGTTGKLLKSGSGFLDAGDLDLGVAGSVKGTLRLAGVTSGNITLKTADIAGSWSLTLPSNDGNSGQILTTNGSGVASWQAGVSSITGTANQVVASASTGAITLSLPQDIHSGASPSFVSLDLTTSGVKTFVTPTGNSVPTKINIPIYNPGAYGQVFSFGLAASAAETSRGVLLVDARTVPHQPTETLLSPDENEGIGFSWDGSNTISYIKSSKRIVAIFGDLTGGGSWQFAFPLTNGTANDVLTNSGSGNTSWSAPGGVGGDVTGSRALNTTYANPSATRALIVMVTARCVATLTNGAATMQGKMDTTATPSTIASGIVGIEAGLLALDETFQLVFTVPAGTANKYRVDSATSNGTVTLGKWFETTL